MNNDQCKTCRHWQEFPANNLAGRCPLLGAVMWPKAEFEEMLKPATDDDRARLEAELSLTHSDALGLPPTTEVLAVRTQHNFGCVLHAPKS